MAGWHVLAAAVRQAWKGAVGRRVAAQDDTVVLNNGRNDGPPDLDELWRDFNRKLGGLMGGRPGGSAPRPPETGGGGDPGPSDRRIAGIGGVRTNRSNPAELWVDHVSVDPKHGGKGFARNIIESIYDYALRREQQVVPSSFSPQGQRLKHIFEEMNLRHPQAASNQPFRDLGK